MRGLWPRFIRMLRSNTNCSPHIMLVRLCTHILQIWASMISFNYGLFLRCRQFLLGLCAIVASSCNSSADPDTSGKPNPPAPADMGPKEVAESLEVDLI